jgi:hypothetical protein
VVTRWLVVDGNAIDDVDLIAGSGFLVQTLHNPSPTSGFAATLIWTGGLHEQRIGGPRHRKGIGRMSRKAKVGKLKLNRAV